tara:strand:- start:1696 stop:2058 length:363 start_codon:yes stop_codon:yes gene_type:complete
MMKKMVLALFLSAGSVYGQLADYSFREATSKDYEEFIHWTGIDPVEMVVCDTVGGWLNSSYIIKDEYDLVSCSEYGGFFTLNDDEWYMVFIYTIDDEDAPYSEVLLTMTDGSISKAYMAN